MKAPKWMLVVMVLFTGAAWAAFDEDYEVKTWQEIEVQLPAPPQEADLMPFFVSAASDNQFFVDKKSLSLGSDGVVRYTLVVLTAGGSRNVSYEGMRCQTKERRLYAFGRRDGTWSKAKGNAWDRVADTGSNRHHAALFLEYFCPDGIIVQSVQEILGYFQRGGSPSINRR